MEKEQFAAKVRAWRKLQKLSQSQAAKALGVNLDTLQNWESARNMPRGIGLGSLLQTLANDITDPQRTKAALKICRVLKRYAEDHNLEPVAKQVDEIVRLLK